jgi:uncharacterized protein with HEPN domain
MRPEERDPACVLDMVLAARQAVAFLGERSVDAVERDALVLSAIAHQLIVAGEAARRVSEGFRQLHPEIPWSQSIGMRNVLVHDYGAVLAGEVVNTVRHDLPGLIEALLPLLPAGAAD